MVRRRLRVARSVLVRLWVRSVSAHVASLLGHLQDNRQIVFSWPEPPENAACIQLGPRVAIFVHFDAAGALRGYVRRYIASLRDAGLDVVFVTNSGKLRPDAVAELKGLCAGVLVRRNVGYDFGAYSDALITLGLPRAETELVVLANDSVYGPIRDLGDVMERIDFSKADMWGLTESWQTRFHLQSYFLVAGRRALRSDAWRQFWAGVRPVPSKYLVVKEYEVGLTQALLRAGLACRAIWPYRELARDIDESLFFKPGRNEAEIADPALDYRRVHARHIRNAVMQRVPLNPTVDLWRQLIDAGFPFLKRELLRKNPSNVADVADWHAKLQSIQADTTEIEADLQRALKQRSP